MNHSPKRKTFTLITQIQMTRTQKLNILKEGEQPHLNPLKVTTEDDMAQ